MAKPRSIASQGLRWRSVTDRCSRSMAAAGEQKISRENEPQRNTDGVLGDRYEERAWRPEGLDRSRDEQHAGHTDHDRDGISGRCAQRGGTREAAGCNQRITELEAGGPGQADGSELEGAVSRREREETR